MLALNNYINSIRSTVEKVFNKTNSATDNEQKTEATESDHRVYYTKISNYLFYILAFILCYQAASLVWNSIPYKNQVIAGLTASELKQIRTPKNQANNMKFDLFGKEMQPEEIPTDAQQVTTSSGQKMVRTTLNIKITGISASTVPGQGSVVMIYNGAEDTYGIGDKINKTNAKVKEIYPDRVVIFNNGRDEVVLLPGDEFKPIKRDYSQDGSKTASKSTKQELQRVRTELLSSPGTLFNYINIKPAIENGKTIGYELTPGSDDKLFINAGLQAGDVAVEINGMDLTDNVQAMAAMAQLQEATSITLVIERNGSRETITLDLQ